MGKRKAVVEDVICNKIRKMVAPPVLCRYDPNLAGDIRAKLHKEKLRKEAELDEKCKYQLEIRTEVGEAWEAVTLKQQPHEHLTPCEVGCVGVYDEITKQLILYEAQEFVAKPKLDEETKEAIQRKMLTEVGSAHLNMAFGSKKSMKKHNDLMKRKEREDIDIERNMTSAAKEVTIATPEGGRGGAGVAPPIWEQASSAEELYSMSSVVADSHLEAYIERAEALLASPLTASSGRPALMEALLAAARLQEDESERLRHTCAALYCQALLAIANNRKLGDEEVPPALRRHFEKEFRGQFKKETKDRALARLMVLSMLINRLSLHVSVLSRSVTRDAAVLHKYAALLRFTVSGGVYKLQLPLPDPPKDRKRAKLSKKGNK